MRKGVSIWKRIGTNRNYNYEGGKKEKKREQEND
jgi:hypothetical protein